MPCMRTLCLLALLGCSTLPAAAAVPLPPRVLAPSGMDAGTGAKDLTALREKMDASKSGGDRERLPGAAIYTQRCRLCHEGQVPKAPSRTFIEMMTPEAIHRALSVGIMQQQPACLSDLYMRHLPD